MNTRPHAFARTIQKCEWLTMCASYHSQETNSRYPEASVWGMKWVDLCVTTSHNVSNLGTPLSTFSVGDGGIAFPHCPASPGLTV